MKTRIVVLGAGFGGLELCTTVSEALGDSVDVTLIDKSDAFVFGYSKLDVMFGRETAAAVRLPYREFVKPGVRVLRETITAIDPVARKVTTDAGVHEADVLVVALGADYDFAATPGLVAGRNEFYSVEGAVHLRDEIPKFTRGHAVVGGCGAPFKCPPAPSETVLMLHDYLSEKGLRAGCEITLVLPLSSPVPPSPETSKALIAAFAERNIRFMPNRCVAQVDSKRNVAILDDGTELPFELFLGIPKHRAPDVVRASGLTEGDWVKVNSRTLETSFPGVYAVGDVAFTGTPKAGVFAEGAARVVAGTLIARARNAGKAAEYAGQGSCYIEFGEGKIARVDVDFFSGPKPTGVYQEPSIMLREEKKVFGSSRRARWFDREA
jgi:sulfide:quinone oxidoreductase